MKLDYSIQSKNKELINALKDFYITENVTDFYKTLFTKEKID